MEINSTIEKVIELLEYIYSLLIDTDDSEEPSIIRDIFNEIENNMRNLSISPKLHDHDSLKSNIIEEVINIFDELSDYINSLNIEITNEVERSVTYYKNHSLSIEQIESIHSKKESVNFIGYHLFTKVEQNMQLVINYNESEKRANEKSNEIIEQLILFSQNLPNFSNSLLTAERLLIINFVNQNNNMGSKDKVFGIQSIDSILESIKDLLSEFILIISSSKRLIMKKVDTFFRLEKGSQELRKELLKDINEIKISNLVDIKIDSEDSKIIKVLSPNKLNSIKSEISRTYSER